MPLTVATGTSAGSAAGHSLTVPSGWTAQVWASVPGARLMSWTPDGRLLVTTDRQGTVVSLTPSASPTTAPSQSVLLSGLDRPQGISVSATPDGGATLVVGQQSSIDRYTLSANGTAQNHRTLVGSLPTGGLHYGKFVLVDGAKVYYSVGTSTDNSPSDRTGTPQRGTISQVPLDGGTSTTVAVGVRNGEGLSVAPDGTLFTAVNQINRAAYPFHGPYGGYADAFGRTDTDWWLDQVADQITRVTPGTDLGWPYCSPDTTHSQPAGALTGIPYVNDPVNNPTGAALDCAALPPTQAGLAAHSAPIGFHFVSSAEAARLGLPGQGAIVVAHGSYQRTPPRAPGAFWLPWDSATKTLGAPVDLISGFQNTDGSRWGRSVDAVVGPDGALYVSDDQAGLVYRLGAGG
ncbi:hypothetical protein ABZX30_16290 [Streptomyces sp. NPDC004542]|uniref:PQQ-dependent sugar dehydrogenase n=1 Tax=Streptomyces sp. NPDC004542 TaxID=3154281 RepID=UPI0033B2092F